MATRVIERLEEIESQREDLLALHLGAMRVMDSTLGGGRGRFRVRSINEDQAARLPEYVRQFVGDRLPAIYFDEEGTVCSGGSYRVDPEDALFTARTSWTNEQTGDTDTWFAWDPATYEMVEDPLSTTSPGRKPRRWLQRTGLGVLAAVEATGFGLLLKGVSEESTYTEVDGAQIAEPSDDINNGIGLLTAGAAGSAIILSAVAIRGLARNETDEES